MGGGANKTKWTESVFSESYTAERRSEEGEGEGGGWERHSHTPLYNTPRSIGNGLISLQPTSPTSRSGTRPGHPCLDQARGGAAAAAATNPLPSTRRRHPARGWRIPGRAFPSHHNIRSMDLVDGLATSGQYPWRAQHLISRGNPLVPPRQPEVFPRLTSHYLPRLGTPYLTG